MKRHENNMYIAADKARATVRKHNKKSILFFNKEKEEFVFQVHNVGKQFVEHPAVFSKDKRGIVSVVEIKLTHKTLREFMDMANVLLNENNLMNKKTI